tara:strand:- start:214 stop:351 length:138 start_codon:yes stop_codon:yes gene_type:complete
MPMWSNNHSLYIAFWHRFGIDEMGIITQEDFDKRAAELKKILLGN